MPVKSEKIVQPNTIDEKSQMVFEQKKGNKIIKYFAYGSNLSKDQMRTRVGDWISSDKASMHKWKLIFNVESSTWGGGAANIKKTDNPMDVVLGVIYFITQEQLDKLTTKYERVSPQLRKVLCNNKNRFAKVYIFNQNKPNLKPTDKYIETIKTGLREHGYSEEIVQYVVSQAKSP